MNEFYTRRMAELILEIVEGHGEGRQVPLDRTLEIGRDQTADVVLEDELVSRRHVRVAPKDAGAIVEDLGSRNGTFVNGNEVHAPTALQPGDRLLLGVTLLELRSSEQVRARPTAVVQRPPALAVVEAPPDFVTPALESETVGTESDLAALLDVRTKAKARAAVLALFVLVAFAVMIYLATR
jgi:pSer/pThr/pTyr-binding forkhead associated (FHA) protein